MPSKRAHQRRKGDDRDREVPRYGCVTKKTGWDHRRGAESAMREAMRFGGIHARGAPLNTIRTAYRCEHCKCWHLTSLQAEQSRGVEKSKRETRVSQAKRDEAAAVCTPREWAFRREAIRKLHGREFVRPSRKDLTTEAARHYGRAFGLTDDERAFWAAINEGDDAARAARAIEESRKMAEEST